MRYMSPPHRLLLHSICLCASGSCRVLLSFFFLMIRRPPRSTLFPSPPLFRSGRAKDSPRLKPRLRVALPPIRPPRLRFQARSEEHTSELQSRLHLVCRLLL